MAKVIVTTDDGEVMDVFCDSQEEIGSLTRLADRDRFMDKVRQNVDLARRRDRRNKNGGKP